MSGTSEDDSPHARDTASAMHGDDSKNASPHSDLDVFFRDGNIVAFTGPPGHSRQYPRSDVESALAFVANFFGFESLFVYQQRCMLSLFTGQMSGDKSGMWTGAKRFSKARGSKVLEPSRIESQ